MEVVRMSRVFIVMNQSPKKHGQEFKVTQAILNLYIFIRRRRSYSQASLTEHEMRRLRHVRCVNNVVIWIVVLGITLFQCQ